MTEYVPRTTSKRKPQIFFLLEEYYWKNRKVVNMVIMLYSKLVSIIQEKNESQSHLFMQCTYAQNFWTTIFNIFGWHLTFPREVNDRLDMTYHSFKNRKPRGYQMTLSFQIILQKNNRYKKKKSKNKESILK